MVSMTITTSFLCNSEAWVNASRKLVVVTRVAKGANGDIEGEKVRFEC